MKLIFVLFSVIFGSNVIVVFNFFFFFHIYKMRWILFIFFLDKKLFFEKKSFDKDDDRVCGGKETK